MLIIEINKPKNNNHMEIYQQKITTFSLLTGQRKDETVKNKDNCVRCSVCLQTPVYKSTINKYQEYKSKSKLPFSLTVFILEHSNLQMTVIIRADGQKKLLRMLFPFQIRCRLTITLSVTENISPVQYRVPLVHYVNLPMCRNMRPLPSSYLN